MKLRSQSKAPRGKRLTSNIGLNLTEDEVVLTQLQANEQQKQRIAKKQSSKLRNNSPTSSSTTVPQKRRPGRPRKTAIELTQDTQHTDPEVEAGLRSLQSQIDWANRILDDDNSEMGFD